MNIHDLAAWCGITFCGATANPLYYATHLYLDGEEILDLVIPESVGKIGYSAFRNCSALSSLTLGSGVTNIGDSAFAYCNGLTSVVIPDGVTDIAGRAFSNCKGLTRAMIGVGVTNIGDSAFRDCSRLKTLYVPAEWEGVETWSVMLDNAKIPSNCEIVYGMPSETMTTPVGVPFS